MRKPKTIVRLREGSKALLELPFATERKYMAAVVESGVLPGRRVLYVKGAPEIVRALCTQAVGDESVETLNERLLGYQRQAMRTLGFAYQILEGDEKVIDAERGVVAERLVYLGTVAISDPVRSDVPEAVEECISAGIDVRSLRATPRQRLQNRSSDRFVGRTSQRTRHHHGTGIRSAQRRRSL